ncbi:MAG: hypothetical protein JNK57_09705 [Planctomycetaceae bacterium]|nr:hypothetical protein [Planctomycetaceae bacterium]
MDSHLTSAAQGQSPRPKAQAWGELHGDTHDTSGSPRGTGISPARHGDSHCGRRHKHGHEHGDDHGGRARGQSPQLRRGTGTTRHGHRSGDSHLHRVTWGQSTRQSNFLGTVTAAEGTSMGTSMGKHGDSHLMTQSPHHKHGDSHRSSAAWGQSPQKWPGDRVAASGQTLRLPRGDRHGDSHHCGAQGMGTVSATEFTSMGTVT